MLQHRSIGGRAASGQHSGYWRFFDTRLPYVVSDACSFRRDAVLGVLPLGRRVPGASGVSPVGAHGLCLPTIVVGPAAAEVDDRTGFLDRLQSSEAGARDFVLIFGIEGTA